METKGVGAWVAMFVGVVWGGVFNEESINKFLTSIHRGKSCEISSGSSSSNCARNSEPGIGRASRIRVHKRRIFDFGTNVYGGGLSDLAKGWLGKKCCVGRKGLRVLWRRGLRNGNCRSRRTFSPPNVSPPFGEQTVFKGRRQRACASLFPLVRILHAHTPHVRCSLKCPRSHSGNPSCRIPANRRPISSPPQKQKAEQTTTPQRCPYFVSLFGFARSFAYKNQSSWSSTDPPSNASTIFSARFFRSFVASSFSSAPPASPTSSASSLSEASLSPSSTSFVALAPFPK